MMKNFFGAALILSLSLPFTATAFNPPIDSKAGVTLEILDINAEEPINQPLSFRVKLTNKTSSGITGAVRVWLNDDWNVDGAEKRELSVPEGESRTLSYHASAATRILTALYPAHAEFTTDDGTISLHPIAVFEAQAGRPHKNAELKTVELKTGLLRLDGDTPRKVCVEHAGHVNVLGVNFRGSDPRSKASFETGTVSRDNKRRSAIKIHPPYHEGTGAVWADYPLLIPEKTPAKLSFHTAIRDSHPEEGAGSDGVEFKVFVLGSDKKPQELFSRFSAAKVWEKAEVDLSAYAGRKITLRLWSGPGPHKNTSCDSGYWGDALIIRGDFHCAIPTSDAWTTREIMAIASARKALKSGADKAQGRFVLNPRGETFGAAVIPGAQGLTDAVFAFSDGEKTLLYRGFEVDIDKTAVGAVEMGAPVLKTKSRYRLGRLYLTHHVAMQSGIVELRARIYADKGALRIAWDMPAAERGKRGSPRYTRLAIGSCNTKLKRFYAGFGNVIEYPDSCRLNAGGFTLSTRHVGADYENGLSLLQATDLFPDAAVYDKENERFSLESPHDTSFFFIPSAKGAFAAARAYRDVSGFKRGPGFKNTVGKMCLDQWGGDYAKAAEDLTKAAKYGLNDSIFVKHVWQRWGYDYRLPEIYPPQGDHADFMAMRAAARDAGIIFAPHDNYIDFYPDAAGYSYDHIIFNEDGTPQKAWFNKGRQALSYRWLPHAFQPWMEANMRAMRRGFQPDGLFIDVFTAIAPLDYYDRDGNYHTRARTAKLWGAAFDTCRRVLKRGSPMISEAGHDALIGSVDAGQADHYGAHRWMPNFEGAAVRTPWHDMASHGRMILLAGGLGHRYSALDWNTPNRTLHGYASDDYLSNTVIGGRNPMCLGPFSRNAVMTYWLQHDICAELGRQEFETHAFDETIMRQRTTFDQGGKVWSNRGDTHWRAYQNYTLPKYGYYAESGENSSGIILLDGQRAAFAHSKSTTFVDARPLFDSLDSTFVRAKVIDGKHLGDGKFTFTVEWELAAAIPEDYKPFLHFDTIDKELDNSDNIAFQAELNLPKDKYKQIGTFKTTTTFTVPNSRKPGDYAIRFGLYNKSNRLPIAGRVTSGRRIKGGIISFRREGSRVIDGSYKTEKRHGNLDELFERNISGKILDFGSIQSDGAFRLLHHNSRSWTLIPLPGSRPFQAVIDMEKLGAGGKSVENISAVEPRGHCGNEIVWSCEGGLLKLNLDAKAFGYKIDF